MDRGTTCPWAPAKSTTYMPSAFFKKWACPHCVRAHVVGQRARCLASSSDRPPPRHSVPFGADPDTEPHAMVRLLARVTGIGIETADLLVHEVLLRNMRDRRAVARYGGLTGSPDRSGGTNREKGMARSGNARVRRVMIQLA